MAQKTFVAGDVLTASDINTYLMGEGGAWTSYTPTWRQSATITFTNNYSKYARHGRMITWLFDLTATSAGTAANGVAIVPPVAAASASGVSGEARFFDQSGNAIYIMNITATSTTEFVFYHDTSTASSFGVAPAVTVAANDVIKGSITYEAAS